MQQNWKSTRQEGVNDGVRFFDVLLAGTASDGGLYIPTTIPKLDMKTIMSWQHLQYRELMLQIMRYFCTEQDLDEPALQAMIHTAYQSFRVKEVVALQRLRNRYVLELFHGPTFSFKDVALQFIGQLYHYAAREFGAKINVLGATSGDTGSAAIHAVYQNPELKACILYPEGKTSDIQRRQMTTIQSPNVMTLAVKGSFDDCQKMVKDVFADTNAVKALSIRAVNSINIVRVLSQMVYYFYAYFQLPEPERKKRLVFSVPSGNFGDALAGYYAKRMGLPIDKIILATNDNDVLTRFVNEGRYQRRKDPAVTYSPAMDIQLASNLERYLYALSDANTVSGWMRIIAAGDAVAFNTQQQQQQIRGDFMSASTSNSDCLNTIRAYWNDAQYLMDPHTACGVAAADRLVPDTKETCVVCLSTAHPGKFDEAIRQGAGIAFELPSELARLLEPDRLERINLCDNDFKAVFSRIRNFFEA